MSKTGMKLTRITLSAKEINIDLFVRKKLDQDRVWVFIEMIEAAKEEAGKSGKSVASHITFPPVKITPDYRMIDGRHRYEAYAFCEITEINCEIVDITDEREIIAEAYRLNLGPMPPKREDTEHAIMLLLDRKVGKNAVAEMLGIAPSIAKKYIANLQAKRNQENLHKGVGLVTEHGYTVDHAAAECSVDPKRLKEHLSGTKRKRGTVEEAKRKITSLARSQGQKVSAQLQRMDDSLDDGDITTAQVREVIEHALASAEQGVRTIRDRLKRFVASHNTNGK